MPVTRDTRGRFAPAKKNPDLECLEGLRTWNLADPCFIGLVVVNDDRQHDTVIRAVFNLKLADVHLVHWSQSRIVFSNGAEIRVRTVRDSLDASHLSGCSFWAVCFLARIPDDAYGRIRSLIRPPATHRVRKPGVRSRDELQAAQAATSAQSRWVSDLINKSAGGVDFAKVHNNTAPWKPKLHDSGLKVGDRVKVNANYTDGAFRGRIGTVKALRNYASWTAVDVLFDGGSCHQTINSIHLANYIAPTNKPFGVMPIVPAMKYDPLKITYKAIPEAIPEPVMTNLKPTPIFDANGGLIGATFPAIAVPKGGKVIVNMTVARDA